MSNYVKLSNYVELAPYRAQSGWLTGAARATLKKVPSSKGMVQLLQRPTHQIHSNPMKLYKMLMKGHVKSEFHELVEPGTATHP